MYSLKRAEMQETEEEKKVQKKELKMWLRLTFLHCLVAAKTTRSNLSTRFSEIKGERSVSRGVTLLAPNS